MVKNYSLLLSFVLFATINVVAQLKVLPNGNVGIGTNNPLQKIQIGNIWTFHNGGTKFIGRNVTYTSQGNIRIEDGYSSMLSFDEYGKISLLAGGTGSINSVVNTSGKNITLTAEGNVGIGTINPDSHKLHIDAPSVLNWGSALYTKVYNQNACAYHLNYGDNDVFYVCAAGWTLTMGNNYMGSDISFKENIKQIENPLEKVLKLNGVKYQFKDPNLRNNPDEFQIGFIAQEVEPIIPEVVKMMHDGTKAIAYSNITAILVEAIKEQQQQIDSLKAELITNSNYTKSIILNDNGNKDNKSDSNNYDNLEFLKLYQNIPNPFNESTTIKCYIPKVINKAEICIYDMSGTLLKCEILTERGYTEIQIQAGQLPAGIYTYILIADGKASETKQMILTK